MEADGQPAADGPDEDVIALAAKVFALARAGATAELTAYVDAGVPVGMVNEAGDSLLMLAAYHGHARTVAALLERGADPGLANDRGQTPLAGAAFKGDEAVARLLVEAGADPQAGAPSALDTARMFHRDGMLVIFGAAS